MVKLQDVNNSLFAAFRQLLGRATYQKIKTKHWDYYPLPCFLAADC
ncbi:MAG: hypothetical protein ACPLRR_05885 [Candidatus Saccharicenans sp.]